MVEARGNNGQISFDGGFVAITREGAGARLTQGRGEKRIPVGQVAAVQIKPAGALTNGFFSVSLAGGSEGNRMKGRRSLAAVQDENSVVFTRKQEPAFLAVRDAIEAAIAARYAPQQAAAPVVSTADQLAQLQGMLKQGLISQAEFELKRGEIIARM